MTSRPSPGLLHALTVLSALELASVLVLVGNLATMRLPGPLRFLARLTAAATLRLR